MQMVGCVAFGIWTSGEGNEANYLADGIGRKHGGISAERIPAASKSVTFIPLSPKSMKTMKMHKGVGKDYESISSSGSSGSDGEVDYADPHSRAGASNPLTNRSLSRRRDDDSHVESESSDSDVEAIPDRFDRQGHPLDGRGQPRSGDVTTRSGQFSRQPQKPGDWSVHGAWQISSTDQVAVDRLVQSVTGALEGKGSWMGVLGDVLGSGGLLGQQSARVDDKKREGRDDDDYNNNDGEVDVDGTRRQRRR